MSFPAISRPIRIFLSYAATSRRDKNLFIKLKNHLSRLRQQGIIDEPSDSASVPKGNSERLAESPINDANIIVLLVSAEYFTSSEIEMKQALERAEARDVHLIPVLLYPVDLEGSPLKQYRIFPPDGKAVSEQVNIEAALAEIASKIRTIAGSTSARSCSEPQFPLDNIPYEHSWFFTDREGILTELYNSFALGQAYQQTRTQALHGPAGIGKTQIAVEYAYRYKHEYQAILWLEATSRDLLNEGIVSLAELLIFSKEDCADEQHRFSALKRWLQHYDKWLLILDNLDGDDFNLMRLFIPSQSSGHVLVTTLSQATGHLAHPVPVAEMEIADSASFLLRRAGITKDRSGRNTVSEIDYMQALSIVQAVGGLSLALDQAGAYIEKTRCSLSRYLEIYPQQEAKLLERRGHPDPVHPKSVKATFSLAFEKVYKECPEALDLLYLFAFLRPTAIPREMIERGASAQNSPLHALFAEAVALDEAIALLLKFALVQCRTDTPLLSIHRVVQVILKEQLTTKQQHQYAAWAVRLVNYVFPQAEFSNWSDCEKYLPQAQHCAELITEFRLTQREAAPLLQRLGSYCYQRGYYQEAEKYLTTALQLYKRGIKPDHPDTALVLNNLALLYKDWGKYQQAEELFQRVRLIDEHTVGPDDPDAAVSLKNLAMVYDEQGRHSLAEPLYRQAFSIEGHTLNADHPAQALNLNTQASWCKEQGDYQRAEELFQRALAIQERSIGPKHPATALTLNNLARLYRIQEKYPEAEVLYRRALNIYEQALGPDHPDIANVLNNLAYLSCQQGHYLEAEELYQRARSIYERAPGPTHPSLAHVLTNLGELYHLMKKDELAEPLLRRGLDICEQVFGLEHLDTSRSLSALVELLIHQQRYEQAEPLFQRILNICRQKLGLGHPDTVSALEQYAILLECINEQKNHNTSRDAASHEK